MQKCLTLTMEGERERERRRWRGGIKESGKKMKIRRALIANFEASHFERGYSYPADVSFRCHWIMSDQASLSLAYDI